MRKPIVRLTDGQKQQAVERYLAGETHRQIAKSFSVVTSSIQWQMRQLGVSARPAIKASPEVQNQICELYEAGESLMKLRDRFGLSQSAVSDALIRAGIKLRPKSSYRKWHFRESFFTEPSPGLAYFAGFCFADGSIIQRNSSWTLSVELQEADRPILLTFCDLLGVPRGCLYERTDRAGRCYSKLCINHPMLADWMRSWGVVLRKTYNFVQPQVPDCLLPHFLRGWIDGDGSISVNRRIWKYSISLCGHPQALAWFVSSLKQLGYSGSPVVRPIPGKHAAKTSFDGHNQAIEVAGIVLWYDRLRLDRKWARLESACPPVQVGMFPTCSNGHELTSENLYTPPGKKPRCRRCRNDRKRESDVRRTEGLTLSSS